MLSNQFLRELETKNVFLFNDNVENKYYFWETPNVIISDGAYGISGFRGDTHTYDKLAEWYEPHIQEWSEKSKAGTTLWFWNTEIGFATVHPILEKYGWEYISCNVWNKGIQHIAGNCNIKTLKSFPIVTEICAQYVRKALLKIDGQEVSLKGWIRQEWNKAGLTLNQANLACGVANAASRKYLTKDHLWYAPPAEHFENLVSYANQCGDEKYRPYFSIDGKISLSKNEYEKLFHVFKGKYGITNVWEVPPLHSRERIKVDGSPKYFHLNQKPLSLMSLIISVSSNEGDVIWEPFGGIFSASLAGHQIGRKVYGAEVDSNIFETGLSRFSSLYYPIQKTIFQTI
jgi:site-specific DNA-methyltransferase (adenine-specific)